MHELKADKAIAGDRLSAIGIFCSSTRTGATVNHKEIRDRQHQLSEARREKQRKLMQEYDETIYLPARRANIAACEKLEHELGPFIQNGLGSAYQVCKWCDATIFEET